MVLLVCGEDYFVGESYMHQRAKQVGVGCSRSQAQRLHSVGAVEVMRAHDILDVFSSR